MATKMTSTRAKALLKERHPNWKYGPAVPEGNWNAQTSEIAITDGGERLGVGLALKAALIDAGAKLEQAPKGKRLAQLTREENDFWTLQFSSCLLHLSMFPDSDKADEEADAFAWEETQRSFPRLREFDGCTKDEPAD